MESKLQHGRDNRHLALRVPTQTCRLLRAHHPYKRTVYVHYPLPRHVDLFEQGMDRFLDAVQLLPQDQDDQQFLRHEHQDQREGIDENRNGDGNLARVELEPIVDWHVWVTRFLRYLFTVLIPVLVLVIASRIFNA
ncbi:hypothetical protein VKT23_017763 [Stygiomarasmius scandens]|uniref:Uncharacterized protein n=1 Tax=Marasmiellus scandens TaxID=2682957 RepID=A0ABR1IVI5_9AGAR